MRNRCGLVLVTTVLTTSLSGCDSSPTESISVKNSQEITPQVVDTSPGVVELISAKAQRQPDKIIRFEVAYKFTSGSPVKNYMLNLGFPGTTVAGNKPMDAWEVKPEGVIKTGMPVGDADAKTFELTFSEADSPDRGYKIISNTLTGDIEAAPEPEQ